MQHELLTVISTWLKGEMVKCDCHWDVRIITPEYNTAALNTLRNIQKIEMTLNHHTR